MVSCMDQYKVVDSPHTDGMGGVSQNHEPDSGETSD